MHGSTLCLGLFGSVFLSALRASACALSKDKSEHCSEALSTMVVSEDEASLLQAGITFSHPKIDHGHYATAKDVAYAKDEHKKDDTDTKVEYGKNQHDKASYSTFSKEGNHKYRHDHARSTHYDVDYHSNSHDYANSVGEDSQYDRYRKSDYDDGDNGKSQYDAYAQGNDNIDDSYAKANYDGDQHGKASVYGYAQEEKHEYAHQHAQDTPYDIDYPGKNYDHARSVVKDSHSTRYQKSDYDDGDNGKTQDEAYAQGKDKAHDNYAKVEYREDQYGKASVYGDNKEEKSKYTNHHAKSTQYDSDHPSENSHYAHSTAADSYVDRYKNSEYGNGDSSKVGDETYTQDTKHKYNNYDEKGNYKQEYNEMYDYASDKHHGDYGEGRSDDDSGDQSGTTSVYGYAKEEKDKYAYRPATDIQYDSDYPAENYHYAPSTTKDSYADHYKNSEYGNGDSSKVGDEKYTEDTKHKYSNFDEKGNYKKEYNEMYDYASDKYHGDYGEGRSADDSEDQQGMASVYGYAKEEKDKYTYRPATDIQYDSDYPAENYRYAHSATKDYTKDYYDVDDNTYTRQRKDENGDHVLLQVAGLSPAAGDVHSKMYQRRHEDTKGEQDEYNDHSRKAGVDASANTKMESINYDHYLKKGKPDRHVHQKNQQFDDGDKASHHAYAKKPTTAKYNDYSGQQKEDSYAHARKTYKYHEVSGKYKEGNAAYAKGKTDHRYDYFRKGKANDYADAKHKKTRYDDYYAQGKSGKYLEKNTKYTDYSGQSQADINDLLKGIFKGLSKGDSYVKKDLQHDDHSRQDQIDVKRLLNGIFKHGPKDDDAHEQQKITEYRGTAGKRKTDDVIYAAKQIADKLAKRKKTALGRMNKYWNLHKWGRRHRFINGRWLRGRLGRWQYFADAKEKATKPYYPQKLKESDYAYAKQSKKDLDSYSGLGKDSKGKDDEYSGIGMANDHVDASTLTTGHGDYSAKEKMVQ